MCQRQYMSNVVGPISPFLAIREYSPLTQTKSLIWWSWQQMSENISFHFICHWHLTTVFFFLHQREEKVNSVTSVQEVGLSGEWWQKIHILKMMDCPHWVYTHSSEHLGQAIIILVWFRGDSLFPQLGNKLKAYDISSREDISGCAHPGISLIVGWALLFCGLKEATGELFAEEGKFWLSLSWVKFLQMSLWYWVRRE